MSRETLPFGGEIVTCVLPSKGGENFGLFRFDPGDRKIYSRIETLMVENSNKSETVPRVVWGRRFLAATVVVPPSIGEHLNNDAMAVLAVIRNEASAT